MNILGNLTRLRHLGAHLLPHSQMALVGGTTLPLLGISRPTIDIDFVGDYVHANLLQRTSMQIAREMQNHVEPVPLERFIPLPKGNEKRVVRIGQFGNLEVFVADPYSIALSKLDRGLDTDFDDLIFLVQNNHVDMHEVEHVLRESLHHANQYDFNPDILERLQELKNRLE